MWEIYNLKTSNSRSFRVKAKEPKTNSQLPKFYCLDEAVEAIVDCRKEGEWVIRGNTRSNY